MQRSCVPDLTPHTHTLSPGEHCWIDITRFIGLIQWTRKKITKNRPESKAYVIGVWQQESGKGPRRVDGAAYCVPNPTPHILYHLAALYGIGTVTASADVRVYVKRERCDVRLLLARFAQSHGRDCKIARFGAGDHEPPPARSPQK